MELIKRHITGFAEEVLDAFPATVIQGARQVGKSTLAAELGATRNARFFTLDDERTRAAAVEDPEGFVNQHPDGLTVIDEVQRLPSLTLSIKAAIDRDRRPGRFLLTGSSDLLRLAGQSDSLAGRAVTVRLRPFSQGEIRGVHDDFAARFRAGIPFSDVTTEVDRAAYAQMIVTGGYANVQGLTLKLRGAWFDAYAERLATRDAPEVAGITDPSRLGSLLRLLAANQAGELVKARLARAAGIPPTSITAYLDAIQTLYLIDVLRPFTANLTSREVGRVKASVADSGLAARLSHVTAAQLLPIDGTANHLGGLLEGFVVGELLKQRSWSSEEYELSHYRTRDGHEVDLVLEFADGQILGLEVKAGETFRPDHFSGLRTLRDRLGDRFAGGIVLNTGRTGYRFAERLWGLPVSALWEPLPS
ncbi:ATP-binding protein [Agromyces archimandritae]|uniref:ATP-binding protein n=1 Tax=Agromyces archimandritae TaxID=2781962 RepID=A0A975FJY7_9MICO|nr:ATP-binding protein [Agromyces archimandritae]QTX03415.1 ATP-binding protein [Agromyces archimandritae]